MTPQSGTELTIAFILRRWSQIIYYKKITCGLAALSLSTEEARGGGAGGAKREPDARKGSLLALTRADHVSTSPTASNAYSQPAHSVLNKLGNN